MWSGGSTQPSHAGPAGQCFAAPGADSGDGGGPEHRAEDERHHEGDRGDIAQGVGVAGRQAKVGRSGFHGGQPLFHPLQMRPPDGFGGGVARPDRLNVAHGGDRSARQRRVEPGEGLLARVGQANRVTPFQSAAPVPRRASTPRPQTASSGRPSCSPSISAATTAKTIDHSGQNARVAHSAAMPMRVSRSGRFSRAAASRGRSGRAMNLCSFGLVPGWD